MRLLILLAIVAFATARVSYDGYQVWRLNVGTIPQQKIENIIQEFNLDVWASTTKWVDIMVSPKQQQSVRRRLVRIGASTEIFIENVQKFIDRDYLAMESRDGQRADFDFLTYHTFDEIEAYLASLPAANSMTSLKSIGKTVLDRDIWQLTISTGAGKQPIWIDCGIHSREWITQATCLWGINNLLTNYGGDNAETRLLDSYDFVIIPVVNPDGYDYTQTDRLWRKNRNNNTGVVCTGVDLNRNFDDHFGGPGTSNISCSDTYRGPFAASELETQAQQAAIGDISATARALFSIHSYSQLWMYPYGFTTDPCPDAAELDIVSKAGCEAIQSVYGTVYDYGDTATTIYLASSTTSDYSYSVGIKHSYTLELRDTGTYGFLLPEDQIEATAIETWTGLFAGIEAIP